MCIGLTSQNVLVWFVENLHRDFNRSLFFHLLQKLVPSLLSTCFRQCLIKQASQRKKINIESVLLLTVCWTVLLFFCLNWCESIRIKTVIFSQAAQTQNQRGLMLFLVICWSFVAGFSYGSLKERETTSHKFRYFVVCIKTYLFCFLFLTFCFWTNFTIYINRTANCGENYRQLEFTLLNAASSIAWLH